MISRHYILLLFLFNCLPFLTGCTINVTVGNKPNIAALENQLKIGQSKQEDILRILGEPFGKGSELLPFKNKPRKMYTYYYEEGSLEDDRRIFLFVFLDNERYDGYLWFSSLPEFKP